MRPVIVQGVPDDPQSHPLATVIRKVFLAASDNLTWLRRGDTVLLKPALNSFDPYPATTHPLALEVISHLLTERGARVVIGDQSGIEHVLHHPGGVIRGSSRDNYIRSGMGSKDDTRFVCFEEGGWDTGFFHHSSEYTRSWPQGFFISTWAKKADHVIILPRVSSHSQAGATLGLKSIVGMLREDSRMEFHANGPFNSFIEAAARGSTLTAEDDRSGTFFEKIVEISDAIRTKHRLTLFVATKAQATFGPDRFAIRIGPAGIGKAYVATPKPGLVFACADPVAADAYALALLISLKSSVPRIPRLMERVVLSRNPNVRALLAIPVKSHPYIRHGIEIGLGEMPHEIRYTDVPYGVQDRIGTILS